MLSTSPLKSLMSEAQRAKLCRRGERMMCFAPRIFQTTTKPPVVTRMHVACELVDADRAALVPPRDAAEYFVLLVLRLLSTQVIWRNIALL
jgi:hypothetical protein